MTIDFPLFLSAWNLCQGQTTPVIHLKMARWLSRSYQVDHPRLLLMAFRAFGKSTLVGVLCAWILLRDPDTRILVLSADLALASKMVRNVKRILEKHPFTRHLLPESADQWGSDRFTIRRHKELRDPSMLAKGITANITGTRADVIICDDVEVPRTSDTPEKRAALRERLHELDYILTPHGAQIYIGTPHCWHSIYAETAREDLGEDRPFLDGFTRMVQPVRNAQGESVWPEKYPDAELDERLRKNGPLKFASQMLCQPVNPSYARFDVTLLQHYTEECVVYESQGRRQVTLCGRKMSGVTAWWDPAFGHAGGDRSILAIVYRDMDGHYWVHRVLSIPVVKDSGVDEATQQCRFVARIAQEFCLPFVAVECNGIGQFLPSILRREMIAIGELPNVRDAYSTQQKSTRILEAFDAKLAAEVIHVHSSVQNTPFVQELEDWYPDKRGGHDDCLDAVAGALSLQPASLPRRSSGEVKISAVTALSASAAQEAKATQVAPMRRSPASVLHQAHTDFRV